ncbi:MAG: LCP family protein, partial [Thermoleophilia bacterium]
MKKKIYTVKDKRSEARRAWSSEEPGFRASRLAETRRARRRQRFTLILIVGVVLSVVIFGAIFFLMRTRGGDEPGGLPAGSGGDINSVLVLVDDSNGELDQVLLLSVPDDTTFRAVSMSARTVAQVPGRGFMKLRDVAALDDQALLDQAVADLLQHPVQYHVELNYETMLLAAEQVGTIDIAA